LFWEFGGEAVATKTSGEIEKDFIDNLEKSTGKSLGAWMKLVAASGVKKRNDIVKWLKEKNGFGHMNAALLTGIYQNAGKPVYGSTADLLDNQFAKAEAMRPLYESFTAFVKKHFPNSTVLPKKTYVSILEKREFAAINIKPKELRIGLDLGDHAFNEMVTKSKLSGPMPRISHMLVITDQAYLNKNLAELLKLSYQRCH
jgi:predicted transport protein